MNKDKLSFKQMLLEHLKKYWDYKQDVWKRKQEEIQYQRRQQYIQERKVYLYECTKQLQKELFYSLQFHHYPCVKTVTNVNDIKIEKIDPRTTNLHYFKMQLTTSNSIYDERRNIRALMNQSIMDFKSTIDYDYQNDPEDAYIDFPFIQNNIKVISVQQEGSQLHIIVKSAICL